MRLLIINGPNMNMLGIRQPDIYGKQTYWDLVWCVEMACKEKEIECECFQSNHEGDIVEKIQRAYGNFDGIVINPAAYTHTSIAIRDALTSVGLPAVEVHLTDTDNREDFRKTSFVRDVCVKTIKGRGFDGYVEAIETLYAIISAPSDAK